jgi:hypothetical protein
MKQDQKDESAVSFDGIYFDILLDFEHAITIITTSAGFADCFVLSFSIRILFFLPNVKLLLFSCQTAIICLIPQVTVGTLIVVMTSSLYIVIGQIDFFFSSLYCVVSCVLLQYM